ncbi:MAG: c-type cytochrome biogenesis protein CcmI [Pseudomonadota bacterium]
MITFYLIAGLIAFGTVILIVLPLLSGRSNAADRDTTDAEVFRDQLAEVERDLARGTIDESEAEGARVEISRRLLTATQRARRNGALIPAPRGSSGMIAGMMIMGLPAAGALLYLVVGSPGVEDQPFAAREISAPTRIASAPAARPSQLEAEARITEDMRAPVEQDPEYVQLVAQLEEMMVRRPDDARGQRLLANGLMRLGRWVDARAAYERLVEITDGPVDAEVQANMAEAMVLAAGGYVSPEAEQAIQAALDGDPSSPMARYYNGLALRQSGRLDDAIAAWEALRQDSPADAPYMQWLNMMLAETVEARRAPVGGPSREDIAAAEDLSDDDRAVMIQGMVDRLAARLAERGGSPQEWAQLIASYSTLKQTAQAEKALLDALASYPDGPSHDSLVALAARLGVSGPEGSGTPSAQETSQAPGPTAEDIAAAQQMTAGDRAQMIEGMVQRLEDRLLSDGGLAEDWLRLIRSYVQLDRKDDAARIYKLADVALAQDPSRGFVREQSLLMGVRIE